VTKGADTGHRWFHREHTLTFGRPLATGSRQLTWRGAALMGIVNVTPDSFSDGGRLPAIDDAVAAGVRLATEGALVVDVGGESTRPGAEPVAASEEERRVVPVIEVLAAHGVLVSIDTRKPDVAAAALAAGARIVNDVGGLRDPAMVEVCAAAGAPAVIMHMQGEPLTMQREPRYADVVAEVHAFLDAAADRALAAGVPDVVVDPGIGFGKTVLHNLALLRATERLAARRSVLVGASRKGFIDRIAAVPRPAERLGGSIAVHLDAARSGAALLRVHDVEQHRQALKLEAALADDLAYSERR
jgi:dihydropteroate synthase